MKTLRIGLVGLAAAVAGFALQGCFDAQPPPECQVTAGNILSYVTNYEMVLTEKSHTGNSCPDMKIMEIGLQRYQLLDGGQVLGIRPARLVDMAMGKVFQGDIDLTNDCSKPDNTLANPCMACQPFSLPPPPNVCKVTVEAVKRVDPSDPNGDGLNGFATYPRTPDKGICAVPEISVSQNFAAVPLPLADGGSSELPALPTKLTLTNMDVMMTSQVPGIAFTASMHYTEGSDCTADYDVLGVHPIVGCNSDADCDPSADLNAGRSSGSGINLSWLPNHADGGCRTDLGPITVHTGSGAVTSAGLCVPTVDLRTLK